MYKKISKVIIFIFLFLITLETLLQIGSLYVRFKYGVKNPETLKSDSLRIMFIGDSWTQGFDAFPYKAGYTDVTMQSLNRLFPWKNIVGYNLGLASMNSSQAVHRFLDNYYKIKPRILVVLIGIDNPWNTQDILTARKRIWSKIHINNKYDNKDILLRERIKGSFKKLKLVKLYNLIWYNLWYKPKEIKVPYDLKTDCYRNYCIILDRTGDYDKAREYLISTYKEGTIDYEEFYEWILHSFELDIYKTQGYLKEKDMLNLRLIKKDVPTRYAGSPMEILEDNLTTLKLLCDQEGIVMIAQNYPHVASVFRDTNAALEKIAKKLNVFYVDQYKFFEERLTQKEWDSVMTPSHLNYKGHEYMAQNLANVLNNIIKKLML